MNYSASKAGSLGVQGACGRIREPRDHRQLCRAGPDRHRHARGLDLAEILKAIPAGRPRDCEQRVAATVAFLFSPDAAYVTRQVIGVNGGLFG